MALVGQTFYRCLYSARRSALAPVRILPDHPRCETATVAYDRVSLRVGTRRVIALATGSRPFLS